MTFSPTTRGVVSQEDRMGITRVVYETAEEYSSRVYIPAGSRLISVSHGITAELRASLRRHRELREAIELRKALLWGKIFR